MIDWAHTLGFVTKVDSIGNLLISVPASPGQENSPVIILQGHMDMVCEKNQDSAHDFFSEPILLCYEGEWLQAAKTTLGADNGAGLAIAMAVAEDISLVRPPLELLFTIDEETGLTGACQLEDDFLTGKVLINLDSEDEGVFTIGCAGGKDTELRLPLEFDPYSKVKNFYKITVRGLMGGHSGINIGEQRANANVLLARALGALMQNVEIRLSSISGGSAHNAIPRESHAFFIVDGQDQGKSKKIIQEIALQLQRDYQYEKNMEIFWEEASTYAGRVYKDAFTRKVIDLLLASPDGVMGWSQNVEGQVETSLNFATIRENNNNLCLLFSKRSDKGHNIDWLTDKIKALARLSGAKHYILNSYPGWQPDVNSDILIRASEVYDSLFSKKPVVEVIHAGLECGIIGSKYPGMDMISIGPTILNPHSPNEKIHVPSIGKVTELLNLLLNSYCE